MASLPICNIPKTPEAPKTSFRRRSEKDYAALSKLIKEYVGADCWAFVVNGEIIFNSYIEKKTYKDKLVERGLRNQIIDNPHATILVEINRKDENVSIEIYMFGTHPFMLQITYDAEEQTYYTEEFASDAHNKMYGSS